MAFTLLNHIHTLVPMSGTRTEPMPALQDAAILLEDHIIRWVGKSEELRIENEELRIAEQRFSLNSQFSILNLSHHIVLPGLINTHHHLFQTLTRCIAVKAKAGQRPAFAFGGLRWKQQGLDCGEFTTCSQ